MDRTVSLSDACAAPNKGYFYPLFAVLYSGEHGPPGGVAVVRRAHAAGIWTAAASGGIHRGRAAGVRASAIAAFTSVLAPIAATVTASAGMAAPSTHAES